MIINRGFKEFKFRHRNKENQIIFTSKKVKNDNEILNLIDNFLKEKNSFIFESVEKGKIKGRYTIFGKNPDKIWEFNNNDFQEFGKDRTQSLLLNSVKDNKKFEISSVELLYSLPLNSFTLINDEKNNIYLVKVKNIINQSINSDNDQFKEYLDKENANAKKNILKSYDLFLNEKYNVVLNQKTIERVKNFFQ